MRRPPYGWVVVGALGVTETISYGVLFYAFSVFVTPMQASLGWSRAETTGAFSLALRDDRRVLARAPRLGPCRSIPSVAGSTSGARAC